MTYTVFTYIDSDFDMENFASRVYNIATLGEALTYVAQTAEAGYDAVHIWCGEPFAAGTVPVVEIAFNR